MLKSLYPSVNWEMVQVVGFDLDGTLYDELDFIRQVYKPIAHCLAEACLGNEDAIYARMLLRWLEKSSSYPHIFEEILRTHGVSDAEQGPIIAECLDLFRGFVPQLTLTWRVRILLNYFAQHFALFLVTNGSVRLQSAKFNALRLSQWFEPHNVVLTGSYGRGYEKPANSVLQYLGVVSRLNDSKTVVFFGDGDVDEAFAARAGFQFVRVNCMHAVRR